MVLLRLAALEYGRSAWRARLWLEGSHHRYGKACGMGLGATCPAGDRAESPACAIPASVAAGPAGAADQRGRAWNTGPRVAHLYDRVAPRRCAFCDRWAGD